MTLKEKLEQIETMLKNFEVDATAQAMVQLALDYGIYEVSDNLISTDRITERLLERIGDDLESGWQSAYMMLKGVKSLACDYYRLNGYNNIENLTTEYLEVMLDKLIDELADQIEEEDADEDEEDID